MKNAKTIGNFFVWILVGWVLMSMFNAPKDTKSDGQSYSDFITEVKSGVVSSVMIEGNSITAIKYDGAEMKTYNPGDLGLMGDLLDSGVNIISKPPREDSLLKKLLISLAPILVIGGIILWMSKKQGGGAGGGVFGVGKSKAKMMSKEMVNIGFESVAGAEEAKAEVSEIVDFLSDPKKYHDLGGKIPKGVLLTGPPATGKTLLAKAVAGEAKVPFYFVSGSDFVEMFVGVGASRVRDMFAEARKNAPCIIFIDEIDAVGRHRGGGQGGGNDEREQTLNQMLVEMDGFEGSDGVIVIAATNRPDVLDNALLRPGRFDRQVNVGLPDIIGREAILKVHAKKITMVEDIRLGDIAKGTPGFSGADLANLVNEAALMAASNGLKEVTMHELEMAKDKIMMGAERKSMGMDKKEKEMTAYHEAGHAIVGRLVPDHDPVYKVTIIPRGRALGVTMFLPEKDSYSQSMEKLESQISVLFGGRIAEEIIYGKGKVSTGASNDIERASKIARNMVTKWGMSESLGPISFSSEMGENGIMESVISAKTFEKVDEEVRSIIDRNYKRAFKILSDNINILHSMTEALMEAETIDVKKIDELMINANSMAA
jgi:cell division protease FtsH